MLAFMRAHTLCRRRTSIACSHVVTPRKLRERNGLCCPGNRGLRGITETGCRWSACRRQRKRLWEPSTFRPLRRLIQTEQHGYSLQVAMRLAPTTCETIYSSEWLEKDGMLLYRVSGSGFLYHMVRNLVGTFVEIGSSRRESTSVPVLIAARDRSRAGPTAPPQGLFLMNVVYAEHESPEAEPAESDPVVLATKFAVTA